VELEELKVFGKWSVQGIAPKDPGLARYINLKPIIVPTSAGRHEAQRFK